MLITNKSFLKQVSNKKLVVAFDISGTHPKYVSTMMALSENCSLKKNKPVMLIFDSDVKDVSFQLQVGLDEPYSLVGGTDVERCMIFIHSLGKPDVVLYVTDGNIPWPKNNILPKIKQYVHLLDPTTIKLVPEHIEII